MQQQKTRSLQDKLKQLNLSRQENDIFQRFSTGETWDMTRSARGTRILSDDKIEDEELTTNQGGCLRKSQ